MKGIIIALGLLTMLGTACVGVKHSDRAVNISLISKGPDKTLLDITTKEWGGYWDSHGLVGYQTVVYRAALTGPGPSYPNPSFQDSPSSFECVGTITIDRIYNTVEIHMQRVVSKPGQEWKIQPHPVNGIYTVDVARDASPEDRWIE